jgi:hypothetical protein
VDWFRVTRTTLRGQFENDRCFLDWIASYPTANVRIVDWVDDPMNDGGPNDRRFYIWFQNIAVSGIKCNPDLMSKDGKNGWATFAEAKAVRDSFIGASADIKEVVVAANKQAMSVGNLYKDLPADIAKGAVDIATSEAFGTAGKIAAAAGILLVLLWLGKR